MSAHENLEHAEHAQHAAHEGGHNKQIALIISVLVLIASLLADILYTLVDPRVRLG